MEQRQYAAELRRLCDLVEQLMLDFPTVSLRTGEIYDAVLLESAVLDDPNFDRIAERDIERLFALYDELFLNGLCGRLARSEGNSLFFRLSPRMTSAAGKTFQRRRVRGGPARYEIAISTTLLFTTFNGEQRPITVSGIECRDRLSALQRVMEHEILHLVEMLVWDASSCSAARFRSMSRRLFGHRESTHQLITPREVARDRYGIRPGDSVTFPFEGRVLTGIVNRVTKRATVLVPDATGEPYSDGRRYVRYYVPLGQLKRV